MLKKYEKELIYKYNIVTLHRVFHGIRFILRLVKIACREISNFFCYLPPYLILSSFVKSMSKR